MPWAELPAADESLTEICHIITDVARTSEGYYPRNYTMGYDKAKRLALWAAYPLHSCYTQGISRERHWGYDPTLAPGEQMTGGVSAPYNRGHQVANADRRVSNLANDQISYYSNMTAQRSNFNSGVWAALEGRVRGWMCADTLYVVTGCHFDGSQTSTIDNGGNTLPVPTQYYKVLLRSKNGSTGRSVASLPADELQAIGFWYEHTEFVGTESGRLRQIGLGNRKTLRIRIFRQRPQRPESELSALGLGLMTHARNKRRPCTVACRAFFASGNLGHIRIGDRLLRPSCREGGGRQPARGHIPARRSIPGPAIVTTHAAHIHLVQTGKTATKSLKTLR